jgi:anti-anti-sigma factor
MAKTSSHWMSLAVGQIFGRVITKDGRAGRWPPPGGGGKFEVRVRLVDHFAVVSLVRPEALIDSESAELLRGHLLRLLEDGHVRQVLDLSEVDRVSATLIGCLAWHHCRLQKRDGVLRIHGVGPTIFRALRDCRLMGVIEVYQDESDALGGINRIKT